MFNTSDPAMNAAMMVFVAILAIVLFVAGAIILAPMAVVGGIGYLFYKNAQEKRIAGPPTAQLAVAATISSVPPTKKYLEDFATHLLQSLNGEIAHSVLVAILDVVEVLYEAEYLGDLPPAPPAGTLEEARHRDMLIERAKKIADAQRTLDLVTSAFAEMAINFTSHLPRPARVFQENVTSTVPLIDLVDTPVLVIMDVCKPFFAEKTKPFGLFKSLRKAIDDNFNREEDSFHFRGTPRETVRAYLKNTPLAHLFDAAIPFSIPRNKYTEHCAIFAPTGHGKTQTLQNLILSFLKEDDPPAMFIMDSMGTMLKLIERLEIFSTHLRDRLVILDPTDSRPPALNLFQLHAPPSLLKYLFKAIDQSFTQRQATMFSYLVALMRKIPNADLTTLCEVCESKTNHYEPYIAQLEPDEQSFFRNQFYSKDPLVNQTKQQIAQRLYTLFQYGTFKHMFNVPTNTFNARECMDQKKIVLINTDANNLDEASPVLGRFFIAQCLAAARSRADLPLHERELALLIIDECKQYVDEQTEEILSDARQFGLGCVLCTQAPHQLTEGVRREIATNTTIKIVGPVDDATASGLAREMNTTREFIMGMRKRSPTDGDPPPHYAEFATHVRGGMTPRAIKLTMPYFSMEREPTMSEESHHAIRARNRALYGADPPAPKMRPVAVAETQRPPISEKPTPPSAHKELRGEHPNISKKKPEQPQTSSPVMELDTEH